MSPGHPPPPWLFLPALALGALLPRLASWAVGEAGWAPAAAEYFGTGRLDRFRGPGPVRVVALGTSLVGRALPFDGDLEALGRVQGHPLRFVRFTRSTRRLDLTPALLAELAGRRPDLLVVEAEWLVWGTPPERPDRAWRVQDQRLYRLVRARLALAAGRLGPAGQGQDMNRPLTDADDDPSLPGAGFDPRRYAAGLERVVPQDPARLETVLAGLADLERRSCRVVVLAFGRSPAASARFPPALAAGFEAGLERLAARGFRVQRNTCPLGQDCYLDEAHLNRPGRERFARWFLDRLDDWTGARP